MSVTDIVINVLRGGIDYRDKDFEPFTVGNVSSKARRYTTDVITTNDVEAALKNLEKKKLICAVLTDRGDAYEMTPEGNSGYNPSVIILPR